MRMGHKAHLNFWPTWPTFLTIKGLFSYPLQTSLKHFSISGPTHSKFFFQCPILPNVPNSVHGNPSSGPYEQGSASTPTRKSPFFISQSLTKSSQIYHNFLFHVYIALEIFSFIRYETLETSSHINTMFSLFPMELRCQINKYSSRSQINSNKLSHQGQGSVLTLFIMTRT